MTQALEMYVKLGPSINVVKPILQNFDPLAFKNQPNLQFLLPHPLPYRVMSFVDAPC